MAYHRGPKLTTDGLITYLDIANPKSYVISGATVNDLVGDNDAVPVGMVYDPEYSGNFTVAPVGSGLKIPLFDFTPFEHEITIDLWISQSTGATGSEQVYYSQDHSTTNSQLMITNDPSNDDLLVYYGTLSATSVVMEVYDFFKPIEGEDWVNITLTANFRIDTLTVYRNGKIVLHRIYPAFAYVIPTQPTGKVTVGGGNLSTNSYLGKFSNVKIYNRALSDTEVFGNYESMAGRFGHDIQNHPLIADSLFFNLDPSNRNNATRDYNIITPEDWVVGDGGLTDWTRNGGVDENHRVTGIGPYGTSEILWEARPDVTLNGDGGWDTSDFQIDASKTYRYSVWVRRTSASADGSFYLGSYGLPNGLYNFTTDVIDTNPYFEVLGLSNPIFVQNEWILEVGYIHHKDYVYTGVHPEAGMFNTSGTRVKTPRAEFKFIDGNFTSRHRAYLYYSTDDTVRMQLAHPRVDIIDGTEPSLNDLITGDFKRVTNVDNQVITTTWTPVLSSGISYLNGSRKSFIKTEQITSFNHSVHSVEGYVDGCVVRCEIAVLNDKIAIGLNSTPTQSQSYNDIDYSWHTEVNGLLYIWENGAFVDSFGNYQVGDALSILYDGVSIHYYHNGIIKRSVARAVGAALHLDSSIYDPNGKLLNVTFMSVPTGPNVIADLDYNSILRPNNDGGIDFNGVNSQVTLSSTVSADSEYWSLEIKFKTDKTPLTGFADIQHFLRFGGTPNNSTYFGILDGKIALFNLEDTGHATVGWKYSNTDINVGDVYTIVLTCNNGYYKLYIDGVLDTAFPYFGLTRNGFNVGTIGSFGGSRYFDGEIYHFRAHNRVLSPEDVHINYHVDSRLEVPKYEGDFGVSAGAFAIEIVAGDSMGFIFDSGDTEATVDWGDGNIITYDLTSMTPTEYSSNDTTYYEQIAGNPNGIAIEHAYSNHLTTNSYIVQVYNTVSAIRIQNYAYKVTKLLSWGDIQYSGIYSMFTRCNQMVNHTSTPPDISLVTHPMYTFELCNKFEVDITGWDFSNVIYFHRTFQHCIAHPSWANISAPACKYFNWVFANTTFNYPLNLNLPNLEQAIGFAYYASFDQPINQLNSPVKIRNIGNGFTNAVNFNQDVSYFDMSLLTNATDAFANTSMTTANYDALLIGWTGWDNGTQLPTKTLQPNVPLGMGTTKYTAGGDAEAARTYLINTLGWIITDGGSIGTTNGVELEVDGTSMGFVFDTKDDIVMVDWGDGNVVIYDLGNMSPTTYSANATDWALNIGVPEAMINDGVTIIHNYTDGAPTHVIKISNTIKNFRVHPPNSNDLTKVLNWGNIAYNGLLATFSECNRCDYYAPTPPNVSSMVGMVLSFDRFASFLPSNNFSISGWDFTSVVTFFNPFYTMTDLGPEFGNINAPVCRRAAYLYYATDFNHPIDGLVMPLCTDMTHMFRGTPFNQPVDVFNTIPLELIDSMFRDATNFNQDVSGWDVTNLKSASSAFLGSGLSTVNYDKLLIGWTGWDNATQLPTKTLQAGVLLGMGTTKYTTGGDAEAARDYLINVLNWQISDGGPL